MRLHRIYINQALNADSSYELSEEASHHVGVVLRLRKDQQLYVFDGRGGHYLAKIKKVSRKCVVIETGERFPDERESDLKITLVQGISRGQRMDYTIQKSIELGVTRIVPVITDFCTLKFTEDTRLKKTDHWRKIMIGACEQSGRNTIPLLEEIQKLNDWITNDINNQKIILDPQAKRNLSSLEKPEETLTLLVGPEGGFSQQEYETTAKHGFISVKLGPRILRTETAALAAISACQTIWGDI